MKTGSRATPLKRNDSEEQLDKAFHQAFSEFILTTDAVKSTFQKSFIAHLKN